MSFTQSASTLKHVVTSSPSQVNSTGKYTYYKMMKKKKPSLQKNKEKKPEDLFVP